MARHPFAMPSRSLALVVLLLSPVSASEPASPFGDATVYAGSGTGGFVDGPATSASFVEPVGLASSLADDSVVVADAGAQRIRKVDRHGNVSTLAGSGMMSSLGIAVAGGYRDGPGSLAKFDRPEAVAIDRDGSIVVADTRNHCLRRIRNGVVTTIAGNPQRPGSTDGTTVSASFEYPRSLAFGTDGAIYIADWGSGVRKLDRQGVVTTVATPAGRRIVGVSVAGAATSQELFVTNGFQTFGVNLKGGPAAFWSADPTAADASGIPGALEGESGTGEMISMKALDRDEYLYTTAESNVVHYVHQRFGAALQANLGTVGDLDSPTGLASLADGRVLVADSGHRRIVAMPGPDRRTSYQAEALPPPRAAGRFRIAYLSNSYIHYDVWWHDSISARVERNLARDAIRVGLNKNVDIYPVRFGPFQGLRDYAVDVIGAGLADAAVIQVNAGFFYPTGIVPWWSDLSTQEALWKPNFVAQLRSIVAALDQAKIPLIVVVQPVESEVSPLERIGGFELEGGGIDVAAQDASTPSLMRAVSQTSAKCTFDMTPAFLQNERSTPRGALFRRNGDIHLSPQGVELVATQLTEAIETCKPWSM